MGRKIRLPLGKLPEEQIRAGIDAASATVAGALSHAWGDGMKMSTEVIHNQNEVARDNRTVNLKIYKTILHLRRGLFEGANVQLTWHRNRPEEVLIDCGSMSAFETWFFRACFLFAGAFAFFYSIRIRFVSEFTSFAFFIAALAVLMVPYLGLRIVMSIHGKSFLDSVEKIVRTEIGANET